MKLLTSDSLKFVQTLCLFPSAGALLNLEVPRWFVGGTKASRMKDASQDGILICFMAFFLPHIFMLVRTFSSTWIQEDTKAKSQWPSFS